MKLERFCLQTPIFMLAMVMLCGCGEKYELDRRMNELCKKDGGVRIYETVILPPEMFDESGYPFPGWRKRPTEDKLGKDYLYRYESTILKDGDPFRGEGRLTRSHIEVVRKSDDKLIAESIEYSRGGGDGIVIGHPTSSVCPGTGGPVEKLAFVKRQPKE